MNLFEKVKQFFRVPSSPDSPRSANPIYVKLLDAHASLMANNLEEAEIFALQGLKESQGKGDRGLEEYALELLNYLWIGNENHQAAIQLFSDYLLAHPTDAVAHHLRGIHFLVRRKSRRSAPRLQSLVRTPSKQRFPHMGQGQILVELGNPKDAIRDLEKVLQTINATPNARDKYWSPTQAYTRNGLGTAFAALGGLSQGLRRVCSIYRSSAGERMGLLQPRTGLRKEK